MPATSIFINAASAGISGIGYSRISVLLGPTRTAARTFSVTTFLQQSLGYGAFHFFSPPPAKRWGGVGGGGNLRALGYVLIHVHFDAARKQHAPPLEDIPRHRIARELLPVQ